MNTTTSTAPPPTAPGNGHDGNGHNTAGHAAHAAALDEHDMPKDLHRPSNFLVAAVALIVVVLLAGIFVIGYIPHHREQARIDADAQAEVNQVPAVQVKYPEPSKPQNDIVLPANVQAWATTALYPRVQGYLASWTHDIGSRVKQGEVLAVISAPDIDAQLRQSKANLEQGKAAVEKTKADVTIAKNTYARYQQWMDTTAGVSKQDLEDKKSAYEDAAAVEHQAEANVDALQAAEQLLAVQQGFETITAPFNGIITARNYDVGALMTPGNSSAKEMFDMAETDKMRVFVSVPQVYATAITTGSAQASLELPRNFPGRPFPGTVARAAGAINPNNRTMNVEIDVPNTDGLVSPGMYGAIRLPVGDPHPTLIVPTSALVFDAKGLRLALLKDNTVHFTTITTGRDFGTSIEVTKGLSPVDQVIDNPGEQLTEGDRVQIEQPDRPAAPASPKVAQAN